jgi:hypothetical protein
MVRRVGLKLPASKRRKTHFVLTTGEDYPIPEYDPV